MKKSATLWLVVYGIIMLGYGSVEMAHDLLHYLADHHHSHLHDHSHGHTHHHFGDHTRIFEQYLAEHASGEPSPEPAAPIGFFLYSQRQPAFAFGSCMIATRVSQPVVFFASPPLLYFTPPPEA